MKFRLIALAAVVFFAGQLSAQEQPVLKNQKEKMSYAVGMDLGRTFRKQSIDLDPAILSKGVADAFSGGKTLMTEQEMVEALNNAGKHSAAKMVHVYDHKNGGP